MGNKLDTGVRNKWEEQASSTKMGPNIDCERLAIERLKILDTWTYFIMKLEHTLDG